MCFRHSFLPNVDETIPDGFEKEVFSYPLKLKPLKIKGVLGTKIKYAPTNLNYDYEKFEFESKSEIEVENYLKSVVKAIEALLSWAENHQPTYLANQIEKNGEAAWIEKLWLAAYAKHAVT